MTSAIAHAAVIAVVTTGLSACTFTFPRDLSVVSISKASRADLTRIVGADAELPFFRGEDGFVVVRVSTHRDIISHAAKRGSTLAANGWLCDDDREIQTAPDVYVQGRGVYSPPSRDAWLAKPMEPTGAGLYEYDTVHSLAGYDLRGAPQDVCLQIGGWYWFVFESNVVRIGGKEIEAAIRQ